MKILMCDPPTGWAYGFPKEMPCDLRGDAFREWLISEGYPEDLITEPFHCRFWEKPCDGSA